MQIKRIVVVIYLVLIFSVIGANASKSLTIKFDGNGSGNIKINDITDPSKNKICSSGKPCSEDLGNNDMGNLTAIALDGSALIGWSKVSSGITCKDANNQCNFNMGNHEQSAIITFEKLPPPPVPELGTYILTTIGIIGLFGIVRLTRK